MDGVASKAIIKRKELLRIYKAINKGKPVSFENRIVRGFSLTEYRRLYGLNDTDFVTIKIISAINAEFVPADKSNICVDFSWGVFVAEDEVGGIAFDKSCFKNGEVNFSYILCQSDLSFQDCTFSGVTMKFVGCKFGKQDISFLNADLGNSDFYFHVCEFGKGDIIFTCSENLLGRVQIASCTFEQRNLEFSEMKNPKADFLFADITLNSGNIFFTNSEVSKILVYGVDFFVRTDFNTAQAEYITIQSSIIGNAMILGNSGYKNTTAICLLDTLNLGKIKILNQFSKKMFARQKKIFSSNEFFDQSQSDNTETGKTRSSREIYEFYRSNLDLKWQLCDTSCEEKAQQMYMLKENAASMGDYVLEDEYYLLGRRYQNKSKIDENTIQFSQLDNSYPQKCAHYYILWFAILLRVIVGCISFCVERIFLDKFCGDYATKPFKFFCVVNLLIFSFAAEYYLIDGTGGLFLIDELIGDSRAATSLYFSLFQFFQVDCGIRLMIPLAYTISLIEKALGMIVLGIFAVSYTRKIIK